MNNGRQASLLIRRTTTKEDAAGDDSPERIVLPVGRVADSDCVDVSVKGQHSGAAAEATEYVAHFVEVDIAIAQRFHLAHGAFTYESLATTRRWDGHEVSKEFDAFRRGFFSQSKRVRRLFRRDHLVLVHD